MKRNQKKGPAVRIHKIGSAAIETAISVSESAIRNLHRLEAGFLLYCLVVLGGWCGVRLADAGLPLDTGWGRADRDPRVIRTARPFRAIAPPSILVDVGDSALQSE